MFLQPCRAAMASRVSFVRLGASLVQRGPPRAHKALLAEEVLWTGPLATTRTRAAPIATVSRLGPSRSYAVVSFAGLGSVICALICQSLRSSLLCGCSVAGRHVINPSGRRPRGVLHAAKDAWPRARLDT